MYIVLKKGKLKQMIYNAVQKAGTYRKLADDIHISRSTLYDYYFREYSIPENNLKILSDYLNIKINEEEIEKKLPNNWKQIRGGKNCVNKKIQNGTFYKQLEICRKNIRNKHSLKEWHKQMKKKDPEAYHLSQYERFKKIGGYKFITKNQERVRNILEKETADTLKTLGLEYKYEPLIKAGSSYFFPDFLVEDKIILECTMWRGYDKAIKLKEKIKKLRKSYKVYVIIPEKLKKYYSSINKYLVTDINQLKELTRIFK